MRKYIIGFVILFLVTSRQVLAQMPMQDTDFTTPAVLTISPQPTPTTQLTPTAVIKEPSIFLERDAFKETHLVTNQQTEEEMLEERAILFNGRIVNDPTLINFMAYTVQYAVHRGVPADTITLILLLPILATIVTFIRLVVGFPTLGLLVPIAFSITLLATGIGAGIILLFSILLASTFSRIMLKNLRIMQLPKVALSMFFVSLFIFITLMLSAMTGVFAVKQISIFPVLLLILLSERIFDLQMERSAIETLRITIVTVLFSIGGFFLLSSEILRTAILVYPELILLLIPANILIGRYFGLRLTEYYRFTPMKDGS